MRLGWGELVGISTPMQRAYRTIQAVSRYPLPVLIAGETGTGRTSVAKSIHAASGGGEASFFSIRCATLPHACAASEDIWQQLCRCKTLLLEEVSELGLMSQAAMLHMLQNKE